jgi:hypothetical protein
MRNRDTRCAIEWRGAKQGAARRTYGGTVAAPAGAVTAAAASFATAPAAAPPPAAAATALPSLPLDLTEAVEIFGLPRAVGPAGEELSPEREAAELLKVAAEVEHGLLVEYLYAAYSLRDRALAQPVLTIAIQEMGHLLTVQNLLLALGEEPYLARQDADPNPDRDPFDFVRAPFSRETLAKFVSAEAPAREHIADPVVAARTDAIAAEAAADGGAPVRRVGVLYAYLYWLFQSGDAPEGPWNPGTKFPFPTGRHVATLARREDELRDVQARPEDWRAGIDGVEILPAANRSEALNALFRIAAQGEGLENTPDSHFDLFFQLFESSFGTGGGGAPPSPQTFPVPTLRAGEVGRPTDDAARRWARLADLFYADLLLAIGDSLTLPGSVPAALSDRVALIEWAFEDMFALGSIGRVLRTLPLDPGQGADQACAALPFNLPDPALPAPGNGRPGWETRRVYVDEALALLGELEGLVTSTQRPTLIQLRGRLTSRRAPIDAHLM